jgi:hypothetical protein
LDGAVRWKHVESPINAQQERILDPLDLLGSHYFSFPCPHPPEGELRSAMRDRALGMPPKVSIIRKLIHIARAVQGSGKPRRGPYRPGANYGSAA